METHIGTVLSKIRDSLVSPGRPEQTMPKPPADSAKKQLWRDKWLKLDTRPHPKLMELETIVAEFCRDVWNEPTQGRTVLLFGENGTAKTHCAKAVARWLRAVGHEKIWIPKENVVAHLEYVYWHWPELLDRFKNQQWDLIDDCLVTPVLILDEVGGGHDPSRVGVDKFCQMLSRREDKWNLITTNILPAAWEEVFDRRIASRFMRNCQQVDLTDVPDYNAWLATQ